MNSRYQGISLRADTIVKLNELGGQWEGSRDSVAIDSGKVIKLPVAAAKKIADSKGKIVSAKKGGAVKKPSKPSASESEGYHAGPALYRYPGANPLESSTTENLCEILCVKVIL
jgi:hypothetical protein